MHEILLEDLQKKVTEKSLKIQEKMFVNSRKIFEKSKIIITRIIWKLWNQNSRKKSLRKNYWNYFVRPKKNILSPYSDVTYSPMTFGKAIIAEATFKTSWVSNWFIDDMSHNLTDDWKRRSDAFVVALMEIFSCSIISTVINKVDGFLKRLFSKHYRFWMD